MTGFNNQSFQYLVNDLINDAFYLRSRSKRGTIATVRQYSEVIVRKILNFSHQEYVTIGDKNVLKDIKDKSNNNPLLINSLKKIQEIGNKCTHTQEIQDVTEQDVETCLNSLFELYAYLFVDYFEKHRFGCNPEIVSAFSILPPIIRYIVLNYLYEKDNSNISIIDKLSLAILKAFNEDQAKAWVEARREQLEKMPSIAEEATLELNKLYGEKITNQIIGGAPNMYQLCVNRLNNVSSTIKDKGGLYDDFESAMLLYKEKGIVEGDTQEVMEFNSIMEFTYLGRKPAQNERLNDKDAYFIFDNLKFGA